ncbi:MAG: DUF4384 domain-containing protein [Planctomycetales bacterium]|nr:DUF4384 domain-containing protein [Planctomycetales bacterium]
MLRNMILTNLLLASVCLSAAADTPDLPRDAATQTGLGLTLNHPNRVYRQGDFLRASFRAPHDCYVYVFYHQADKTAVLLYPNLEHGDHHLQGGQAVNVPGVEDRVQCRIAGPFGREAVQVIASQTPIAYFEDALRTVQGVAVIPSMQVDAVCQQVAQQSGLRAEFVTLDTQASPPREPAK